MVLRTIIIIIIINISIVLMIISAVARAPRNKVRNIGCIYAEEGWPQRNRK